MVTSSNQTGTPSGDWCSASTTGPSAIHSTRWSVKSTPFPPTLTQGTRLPKNPLCFWYPGPMRLVTEPSGHSSPTIPKARPLPMG